MNCIECAVAFPRNNELATIPDASKIAFDPAFKRVWRICDGCGAWNLMGREASQATLAELEMRFPLGAVEQYHDMGRSVISGGLQLIRLESDSTSTEDVPGTAIRHDPAVKKRIRQLRRGAFFGSIFVLWYLYQSANGIWLILHKAYDKIAPNPLPYSLAFAMIVAASALVAAFGEPNIGPFRTKAFAYLKTIGKFVFLATLTIGALAFVMFELIDVSAEGVSYVNTLVGAPLFGLAIVSRHTRREINLKKLRLWSAGIFASGVVVGTIRSATFVPEMFWTFVMFFGTGAALGLIFRWTRYRTEVTHAKMGIEEFAHIDHTEYAQTKINWDDSGENISLSNLPDGHSIDGVRARRVLQKILVAQHNIEKPGRQILASAEELLRASGGLAGVLRSLNQYKAIREEDVLLFGLPEVTRVAIDLGLTEECQMANKKFQQLRTEAEDAVDVAKVAEELDREIGPLPY